MRKLLFLSFFSVLFFTTCKKDPEQVDNESIIVLRWNKSYTAETRENIETGLKWTFSFLGARLPAGTFFRACTWNNDKITIDCTRLGFNEKALVSLRSIITHIKKNEEYTTKGGIDIGRFVMLTMNSVNHYYAITGANNELSTFRSAFAFDMKKAGIIQSAISKSHRIIEVPLAHNVAQLGYVAAEGTGSLLDSSFRVTEYEVFNIMDNGQLRFALYDIAGRLKQNADTTLSPASKPSKCLWCHEINIQPPFYAQTDVPNYYTHLEFKDLVNDKKNLLAQYRVSLQSDIDFSKKQDHTFAELLYISFMEPSAERLSMEWEMSVEDVKKRLGGLLTHGHAEFPYLGTLYDRNEVDLRSPYTYIRVPESAREYSSYEPDLLH